MGGKRTHRSVRCIGCRMILELCICDAIPSVRTRARFVFVMHRAERFKTTNTGRLAVLSLVDAVRTEFVGRTEPFEPPLELGEDGATAVLFPPRDDEPPAVDVSRWADAVEADGRRPVVVVPDGTWGQCRKMVSRHATLASLPRLALPAGARPRGGLRMECLATGMSTIDAVAWLVAALDGEERAAPIVALHRRMVEWTLASRGRPLPGGPTLKEVLEGIER